MGTEYASRLQIICGDVIKMELPYFDVCVANIPYQISSPLVFKLLAHRPIFRCAVIMVQQEFAMRMVAGPGDPLYCRLSINCRLLSKCTHLMKVGKNNFKPPPKVESSVIKIVPHNPPPPINFIEWDGLLRLCFTRKNKTIGAIFKQDSVVKLLEQNLKTWCALNQKNFEDYPDMKQTIEEVLNDEEHFGDKRSRTLDVDDFLKLLSLFNKRDVRFA